jgi:NTP pyrophosphatase (non-canonical NTP hydrolase)
MKKHEKLLVKLMEECGELTQACSKVLKTKGQDPVQLARLWDEIGDVKKYIAKVEKQMGPWDISIKENIDIDNENTGC